MQRSSMTDQYPLDNESRSSGLQRFALLSNSLFAKLAWLPALRDRGSGRTQTRCHLLGKAWVRVVIRVQKLPLVLEGLRAYEDQLPSIHSLPPPASHPHADARRSRSA